MTQGNSNSDRADRLERVEFTDALQQPLTAACNYIGAARILLCSGDRPPNGPAIDKLDRAEVQILRAGDMIRRFQRSELKRRAKD